jgi:carboxypeptidase Q
MKILSWKLRVSKLALIVFFFSTHAFAQNQYQSSLSDSVFIKMVSNNVFENPLARTNLYTLTKTIGGRLAGSPQMVKAEKWGAAALQEAGADKVILQECMVTHWVRGGIDEASVIYKTSGKGTVTVPLNVLALGNSNGTGNKGVLAPLMRVHSFDELEQRKDEIKGKIVFYDVPFEDTFIHTFEAYSKNVIYRSDGASKAAKYGAVAVLVRSMTHAPDNNPHTGALDYNDSFPKIPAAAVGLWDVKKLDSFFDKKISLSAQLFTYGKMLPDTMGHNVIGELRGTESPEEIITIGGHLDSWDVNEGANDDGAGVVQTIEVLRAFKALDYHPKRTIHFVLFANEENGQGGAKKYAEDAKAKNEKYIFALESDAGGFTPRGFGFTVNDEAWKKINGWKDLFEPYGGCDFARGGDGTDIDPLGALGTALAGLRPDSQRYFDFHHAVTDVFENVNIREMKLGAINMAALIYLVDKYGL